MKLISDPLHADLVNYLSLRPWREVAPAMQALQALPDDGVTLQTLYECVVSGQVPESRVAELMRDPLFAAYYAKRQK